MFAPVDLAKDTEKVRLEIVQEQHEIVQEQDKNNNYLIFKEDVTVEL